MSARHAPHPPPPPPPADAPPSKTRVYVHNLDWSVTWQLLKDHMRAAGEVLRAEVLLKPNGQSRGYGYVEYSSMAEAKNAVRTLHDSMLLDRKISVREVRWRAGGRPRPCAVVSLAPARSAGGSGVSGGAWVPLLCTPRETVCVFVCCSLRTRRWMR